MRWLRVGPHFPILPPASHARPRMQLTAGPGLLLPKHRREPVVAGENLGGIRDAWGRCAWTRARGLETCFLGGRIFLCLGHWVPGSCRLGDVFRRHLGDIPATAGGPAAAFLLRPIGFPAWGDSATIDTDGNVSVGEAIVLPYRPEICLCCSVRAGRSHVSEAGLRLTRKTPTVPFRVAVRCSSWERRMCFSGNKPRRL